MQHLTFFHLVAECRHVGTEFGCDLAGNQGDLNGQILSKGNSEPHVITSALGDPTHYHFRKHLPSKKSAVRLAPSVSTCSWNPPGLAAELEAQTRQDARGSSGRSELHRCPNSCEKRLQEGAQTSHMLLLHNQILCNEVLRLRDEIASDSQSSTSRSPVSGILCCMWCILSAAGVDLFHGQLLFTYASVHVHVMISNMRAYRIAG